MKSIRIPEEVKFILRVLNSAGYEAFIVGGCVRDSVMGRTPGDWDITTNAKPHEVKFLFSKTIDTGIKHGTVTVVVNRINFEITTYRIEGEYRDNRHPERVEFTSSLKDDLGRRDFTVNSIAYHPEEGFVDPFNGIQDIRDCIIRAVGSPGERFREDALRMLRAVRFSAQLGFDIEPSTYEAIVENKGLILNISKERVRDELTKTLVSSQPERFMLLYESGLLKLLLPEVEACFITVQNNPYHIYDVGRHTLKTVSFIEMDPVLRWAMLLHDTGKPITRETDEQGIDHFYGHVEKSVDLAQAIMERLKFDNKSTNTVCRLIRYHDRQIAAEDKSVRKAVKVVGEDIFHDLLKVKEADMRAQNPEKLENRLAELTQIKEIFAHILEKKHCVSLKDLALKGDDLVGLGCPPGKELGQILEKLLDLVIENPELNDKDKLLDLVKSGL